MAVQCYMVSSTYLTNVNSTSENICSNQDAHLVIAESLHDLIALKWRQFTTEHIDSKVLILQVACEQACSLSCLVELHTGISFVSLLSRTHTLSLSLSLSLSCE
jgi:hypothetical protein